MKKIFIISIFAALTLSGCSNLDVVGNDSVRAFGEVLTVCIPATNEREWCLSAPDGSADFYWNAESATIRTDAKPFLDAGLDPEKLSGNYGYSAYEDGGKILTVGIAFSGKTVNNASSSATAEYEKIVGNHRDSINYHTSLDHYGVKLGDGNMFEWAKDMKTNGYDNSVQDKDIVFVLNPEPLISAGVDPDKVQGWEYAEVETDNGKVWKFLKPFDLE